MSESRECLWSPRRGWLPLGVGLLMLSGAWQGRAQAPAKPADALVCPPIERLIWKAPQRIQWQLAESPLWFSLGHPARVMCWIPVGVAERDGKLVETFNGSGRVVAVRIELHDVEAFDTNSLAPLRTRLATNVTIRADDPKALERKKGWGFPTEQGKDFEFGLIPSFEHQTLFRLYRHEASRFWQTLMIHTEAQTEEMPAALAEKAGSKRAFTKLMSYTIVCELLNDPELKMTSTYIEPDDPPSTAWLDKEPVKPPWSAGKTALEPARGSLIVENGRMRFVSFNETARQAAAELSRVKGEKSAPNQSIRWEKEAGGAEDLSVEGSGKPDDR